MSILQEILKQKKAELKESRSAVPLSELKARLPDLAPVKDFRTAIKRQDNGPVRLIAEIKKASPSKGLIRQDFDLREIVAAYKEKNADAISVLTDRKFFQGSLEFLKAARGLTHRPLLRKDFIIDAYQVYESRVNGADALLLIVAALDRHQLSDLMALSTELSLACLTEVHNFKELDTSLYAGCDIIGINNRDLNSLEIDLKTTPQLLRDIPDSKIIVSESGISTRADVEALELTKTDAMLIGTVLMKSRDIGAKIDELRGK